MKKISILLLVFSLVISSCSSSDSDGDSESLSYAMTAKINGVTFEANNPFGGNLFSSTNLWDRFPKEDFVLLQARAGGVFGNPEINLWLKRSDIVVGSYTVSQETLDTPPSHFIDLIDNSNNIFEHTKSGIVVITEVNTSSKIVKGTFEFKTVQDLNDPNALIDFNVTNGTFRYQYFE